jgi:hypothetical protein
MSYFGNQTGAGADAWGSAELIWNTTAYECVGTGNQNIQDLLCKCDENGTRVRLGVYNAGGTTLIAEGVNYTTLTGTLGYQGHVNQAAVKTAGGASPGVVAGGTTYLLAIATNGAMENSYNSSGAGAAYKAQDSTGGLPSSLPAATPLANYDLLIYCTYSAAGGGGATAVPEYYANVILKKKRMSWLY